MLFLLLLSFKYILYNNAKLLTLCYIINVFLLITIITRNDLIIVINYYCIVIKIAQLREKI